MKYMGKSCNTRKLLVMYFCNILGTYYFYINLMIGGIGNEGYGEIMVNGRVKCRAFSSGAHWLEHSQCSTITDLNKGDRVWVRTGSNGPYAFHGLSRFTGYVISVQF